MIQSRQSLVGKIEYPVHCIRDLETLYTMYTIHNYL